MPEDLLVLEIEALGGLSAGDAAPFLKKVTDIVPGIIYVFNQETQSNEYSNHSIGASLGYSADDILEMDRNFMPLLCHVDDPKPSANAMKFLLAELLDTHVETLDPDAVNLVGMALATAGRMGQLVEGVQHYTHFIGQDITIPPIDLDAVLAEVAFDLTAKIRAKGAIMESANLPSVLGDRPQLLNFFQNLIENALMFHPIGTGPKIRVCASEQEHNADHSITVRDNGNGIKPRKHKQVFMNFKRLNSDMEFSGTGLVVAICRRIAANHGSKITLISAPGEGAAFSIGLRRA